MPPKEPTRAQYSSKLAYQGRTPAFLLKLQNQVAGRGANEDEDDPQYVDGDTDEFGRQRPPPVPERPGNEGESDTDEVDDEKPTIVVVNESKHLSESEVVNEKRKAKGLSPLPPKSTGSVAEVGKSPPDLDSKQSMSLSFSSKKEQRFKQGNLKRKFPSKPDESSSKPKKKSKKSSKGGLSFDRDDIG